LIDVAADTVDVVGRKIPCQRQGQRVLPRADPIERLSHEGERDFFTPPDRGQALVFR
jgi:hypothetical protein